MSGITGLISGSMSASASKEAADQQFKASMAALKVQQETDALNRQFYMDLYDKSQEVYNQEVMRAEPFREGGLFGLEMLIGTDNFQRQIQPYVTQSQKDLWESPAYDESTSDPDLKRQIDAYTALQADVRGGKLPNTQDLVNKFGPEGAKKMYLGIIQEKYSDLLPQGMGLGDIPGGVEKWLQNPVPIDKYGRPIDQQTILQYQQGGTQGQGGPLTAGTRTPATSVTGQPVAAGGAPAGGGAFGGGNDNGWWGSGGTDYQGQPVGAGGETLTEEQLAGGNAFAPQGYTAQGQGQPGAMFSQPEYQGYQMGPEYTMEAFMQDPSNRLAMDEIARGLESGAVARTGTLGPNQAKDITKYQTDYIYNKYPEMRNMYFGEQLSQKQQNEAEQQNAFNRWISGTLNPAQSLAGMGQTSGVSSAAQPGTPPYSSGGSEYLQEGGNALASGSLGAASGWQNALNQNANAGMTVASLFMGGAGGAAAGGTPTIPNFNGM